MEEEEVKMQNIDIRQFETVQTLDDADYIVLSLGDGASAKVMAGLLKNLLSAHIRPNVKDGYWYVGATNTNVVATGRTPEMRKGSLGIEYKYTDEDDSAWRLLVPYSDIKLQFDSLSDEQKVEVYEGVSAQVEKEIIADVNLAVDTAVKSANEAATKADKTADDAEKRTEQAVTEAMNKLEETLSNQVIALELDVNGDLVAHFGKEHTEFENGYISENGDIVLEFNYE